MSNESDLRKELDFLTKEKHKESDKLSTVTDSDIAKTKRKPATKTQTRKPKSPAKRQYADDDDFDDIQPRRKKPSKGTSRQQPETYSEKHHKSIAMRKIEEASDMSNIDCFKSDDELLGIKSKFKSKAKEGKDKLVGKIDEQTKGDVPEMIEILVKLVLSPYVFFKLYFKKAVEDDFPVKTLKWVILTYFFLVCGILILEIWHGTNNFIQLIFPTATIIGIVAKSRLNNK